MSRGFLITIIMSLILIFIVAWSLLRRERGVWTYMLLSPRTFSLELLELLRNLREASKALGKSLIKFMAYNLQLSISIDYFKSDMGSLNRY